MLCTMPMGRRGLRQLPQLLFLSLMALPPTWLLASVSAATGGSSTGASSSFNSASSITSSAWFQVPDMLFEPLFARYPSTRELASHDAVYRNTMWGRLLAESDSLNHEDLQLREEKFKKYHFPVFLYLKALLQEHRAKKRKGPLFVGISATQGAGKTTLTNIITDLFRSNDVHCLALSIDDFYLTGAEQEQLASGEYKHNRLLEYRGNAGTHDLPLLMKTLGALKSMNVDSIRDNRSNNIGNEGVVVDTDGSFSPETASVSSATSSSATAAPVLVPRYDKSLREGRGDRAPLSQWTKIHHPVDIVLLEGWMMGFHSIDAADDSSSISSSESRGVFDFTRESDVHQFRSIADNDALAHNTIGNNLKEINELLRAYEPLHEFMDAWLLLAVERVQLVYQWRQQAESRMRDSGRPALTEQQLENFVARFMPPYQVYLPALYSEGPHRKMHDEAGYKTPVLKIEIGSERQPLQVNFIEPPPNQSEAVTSATEEADHLSSTHN